MSGIFLTTAWVCIAYFVVAVYVGKNGMAATLSATPARRYLTLLMLSPVPLVLWAQNAFGFQASSREFLLVAAALLVGWLIGRSRRFTASGGELPLPLAVRLTEDGTYLDPDGGFSISVPPGWAPTPQRMDFVSSGGRLGIAHESGNASLNVRAELLANMNRANAAHRRVTILSSIRSCAYDDTEITDEELTAEQNAVFAQWCHSDGWHSGVVSVVHGGREYIIRWNATPEFKSEVSQVIQSFRFT